MFYKDMSTILKDAKCGSFALEHYEIKEDDLYALFHGIPSGAYIKLTQDNAVVMSNTEMEKKTNAEFVKRSHGNVFIGGLGIGMIILPIQDKPDVQKITVIEKHQEVINLVSGQLPLNSKVTIIHADIYDYIPQEKYNTIYLDIWNYISKDIYKNSMKPLLKKYRSYLVAKSVDSDRLIDCWCRKEAKAGIQI